MARGEGWTTRPAGSATPTRPTRLGRSEKRRRSCGNKQQVVKDAWLGKFVDRDGIHSGGFGGGGAHAREAVRESVGRLDLAVHAQGQEGGKSYKLWVIAHLEGKRDYMAPVADTRLAAIADRADADGWNPQGHEADFRVFEPITSRARACRRAVHLRTREEAQEALAELIFEGARSSSPRREGGR